MQNQESQARFGSLPAPATPQAGVTLAQSPLSAQQDDTGIRPQEVPNSYVEKEHELKLKFADELHQYVIEHIRLADQKAIFFFASGTAILAYLHKQGLTRHWIKSPMLWHFTDMMAFFATAGLCVSALACLLTVMPRLKGSRRGLIYFAAIRELDSAEAYANEVHTQSILELLDAKLKHVYALSGVCQRKYAVLKWGQWIGAIGIMAALWLFVLSPSSPQPGRSW
jgi:hypothetical protein